MSAGLGEAEAKLKTSLSLRKPPASTSLGWGVWQVAAP